MNNVVKDACWSGSVQSESFACHARRKAELQEKDSLQQQVQQAQQAHGNAWLEGKTIGAFGLSKEYAWNHRAFEIQTHNPHILADTGPRGS